MPRKAKIVAVPVDAATVAEPVEQTAQEDKTDAEEMTNVINEIKTCLLYTSPSPRDCS